MHTLLKAAGGAGNQVCILIGIFDSVMRGLESVSVNMYVHKPVHLFNIYLYQDEY